MISSIAMRKFKKFWKSLGPGLITGAADDEPSAIATYTIAGAKFGYSMLWLALFSLPLMISVQEMSARIGRISNKGLAGNLKLHYPRWIVAVIAIIIVGANIINMGADMSGMAQAISMIIPASERISATVITFVILALVILLPYQKIFTIFKWMALTLLAYIFASFTVHQDWRLIISHLFIPEFKATKEFWVILTAFMGTTLSPYLFFWQANQEVEEKIIQQCKPGRICRLRPPTDSDLKKIDEDTRIGMTFSNIITFFIITLTASTLFRAGFNDIDTLKDAAEALKPLAGEYAYLLFTIGIVGSGFLAIPVLAGSAAYAISEVFGWSDGFNKSFTKAKEFYAVIIISTLVALGIPLLGIHPIKAMFLTSIIFGVISPILIIMIIHMANNKKIMGEHVNGWGLNTFGYLTFFIMLAISISVFFLL